MLKKALVGAMLLPFIALSALAQDRSTDHHYQGGPKSEVPHHIGKRPTGPDTGTTSQAGQHHYQGGPKTEVPHHIGDRPAAKMPKAKKAKRNKKSST